MEDEQTRRLHDGLHGGVRLAEDEDSEGTTRSLNGVDGGRFRDFEGWHGLRFSSFVIYGLVMILLATVFNVVGQP